MKAFPLCLVMLLGCGDDGSASLDPDADGPDAALDAPATPACGDGIALGPGQVVTSSGVVQGVTGATGSAWLGIPYAAAPVGAARYQPPQPPACRPAVSPATAFGPKCPQLEDGTFVGAEDCLHLNVWAPANASGAPLPVLVFMHGGAHQVGSTSQQQNGIPIYDGARLATTSQALVVTLNYRLGALGFLAHPALSAESGHGSGNYGMLDQIAALEWVRDHAAAFGGDPSRVLVFGESAGAVSVCRLVASPLAAGLFDAAIMESGACVARPLADAEAFGVEIATEVGCSDAACLRATSVEALIATTPDVATESLRQTYDGVIDGYALPRAPLEQIAARAHNQVPMIVGSNTEEQGRAVPLQMTEAAYAAAVQSYATSSGVPQFADELLALYPAAAYTRPRDAMVALLTDTKFTCPGLKALRTVARSQSQPVFRYAFGKVPDNAPPAAQLLGAFHGLELAYVFDALGSAGGAADAAVASTMGEAWGALAASGTPQHEQWAPFTTSSEAHLMLDDTIAGGTDYRTATCDALAALVGSEIDRH